jgi:hypothetical protein
VSLIVRVIAEKKGTGNISDVAVEKSSSFLPFSLSVVKNKLVRLLERQ